MGELNEPLVSLITPCYNGETYLKGYLDGLLAQNYSNVEVIFINDGSTDKTEEIINTYKDAIKQKFAKFRYIFQENKGVTFAVNRGLEIFNGKYLTWPDADDIMFPDNIKDKVHYLENHPECDMVLVQGEEVDESNTEIVINKIQRIPHNPDTFFDDLVKSKKVVFCPIAYMVRREAFFNAYPDRQIYAEKKVGQNLQLLLPIAYNGKCGFLDKQLYKYLIRQNSRCRSAKSYEQMMDSADYRERTQEIVLKGIKGLDYLKYSDDVTEKYTRRRLDAASKFRRIKDIKSQYNILKKINRCKKKDILLYKLRFIPKSYELIELLSKVYTSRKKI